MKHQALGRRLKALSKQMSDQWKKNLPPNILGFQPGLPDILLYAMFNNTQLSLLIQTAWLVSCAAVSLFWK